jgi:hypothetical protein
MRLAAAIIVIAAAAPAEAVELGGPVTRFTPVMMEQIYRSPRAEAEALFVDSTVLASLAGVADELQAKLPFAADVVIYFAEGGDVLVWSDKSAVVEVGYWELLASRGFNDLCIRFGNFGLDSLCAAVDIEQSGWIVESTPGNPFGLAGGAATPASLAGGDIGLNALAGRLP